LETLEVQMKQTQSSSMLAMGSTVESALNEVLKSLMTNMANQSQEICEGIEEVLACVKRGQGGGAGEGGNEEVWKKLMEVKRRMDAIWEDRRVARPSHGREVKGAVGRSVDRTRERERWVKREERMILMLQWWKTILSTLWDDRPTRLAFWILWDASIASRLLLRSAGPSLSTQRTLSQLETFSNKCWPPNQYRLSLRGEEQIHRGGRGGRAWWEAPCWVNEGLVESERCPRLEPEENMSPEEPTEKIQILWRLTRVRDQNICASKWFHSIEQMSQDPASLIKILDTWAREQESRVDDETEIVDDDNSWEMWIELQWREISDEISGALIVRQLNITETLSTWVSSDREVRNRFQGLWRETVDK
jgi:hypothetical protein